MHATLDSHEAADVAARLAVARTRTVHRQMLAAARDCLRDPATEKQGRVLAAWATELGRAIDA